MLIDDLIQKQERTRARSSRRARRANFAHSKATAYSVRRALVELDLRGNVEKFFVARDQFDRMANQYNRRARLLNDSAIDILVRGTL